MNDADRQDELFESLTIERSAVEPMTPPFTGFGPHPQWWNWWGGPYPVHSRWNLKNQKDIEYRNKEGQLHRIFGPAYISILYKVEAWYKDGLRHRVGGPAYTHKDTNIWFYEDKLHRLDGPAVIEGGGPKQHWIMGQRLSPKEYKKEIARRKRKGLIK
jgi:hypothetical protein